MIAMTQAEAMHRHFEVAELYIKVTVLGNVVEPLEVVGTLTVEFSVFVQPIVSDVPAKS